MNIKELLINQASLFPQKCAFNFEGKETTFLELKDAAFKIANYFTRQGVKKPDKIAIFTANTPDAIYAQMAAYSIGATLIPFDFMLTEKEIIHLLNHSEPRVLIMQPKKDIDILNIRENCYSVKYIITTKSVFPTVIFLMIYWRRKATKRLFPHLRIKTSPQYFTLPVQPATPRALCLAISNSITRLIP
jgi:long-subunit acyl-CoA synthetase (AMP-forming)